MNKVKTTVILFFVYNLVFSQNHFFSKYEKYDYDKKYSNYYKLLNENENSLILKVNQNNYIAFQNNKDIYKINIGYLSGKIVKKEKIEDSKKNEYNTLLDSLNKINPNTINYTKNNTKGIDILIQDAATFQLELIKNNYYVDYSSYAAKEYIDEKVEFYEERIKLLNLIEKANSLFNNENSFKNKDTIYIKISSSDFTKFKINSTKIKGKSSKLYCFNSMNEKIFETGLENKTLVAKDFLNNNKNEILNLDYFDLNGFDLIFRNKKNIYLFNENELCKKRIEIKKNIDNLR